MGRVAVHLPVTDRDARDIGARSKSIPSFNFGQRISNIRGDRGTSWSQLVFIRSMGIVSGLGVAARPSLAVPDLKRAEAPELDVVAARQRILHSIEEGVDHQPAVRLGDSRPGRFRRRCLQNRPSEIDRAHESHAAGPRSRPRAGRRSRYGTPPSRSSGPSCSSWECAARSTKYAAVITALTEGLPTSGRLRRSGRATPKTVSYRTASRRWRTGLLDAVAPVPLGRAASTVRQMSAI